MGAWAASLGEHWGGRDVSAKSTRLPRILSLARPWDRQTPLSRSVTDPSPMTLATVIRPGKPPWRSFTERQRSLCVTSICFYGAVLSVCLHP